MNTTEDEKLLIQSAFAGQVAYVDTLLLMPFRGRVLAKAYMIAARRGLKLQPNYKLRQDMSNSFIKVAQARNKALKKLKPDQHINETLIDQGRQCLVVAKKIYAIIEPLLIYDDHANQMMHYIIKLNQVHTLQDFILLYSIYIDINHQTDKGKTLLHQACQLGNLEMVQFLINQGADVSIQTYYFKNKKSSHQTALHIAVLNHHIEITNLLLTCVNIKDYFGRTPLFYVGPGPSGNMAIFQLLLNHGANINEKCPETLLYRAVKDNRADAVAYLLSQGACPTTPSLVSSNNILFVYCYETPLDAARKHYTEEDDIVNNYRIFNLLSAIKC